MKRLIVLAALGAAATVIATPATAKTPAERFASCLAQSRPEQVRQLLQASSAVAANTPYHQLTDDDRCFTRVFGDKQFRPEDVGASLDMLRGRLAEQELLAQSARVAALQALPLQQKRYTRAWFASTGRNAAVDEMGACMADTDPSGIAALIRTDPGTDEESSAIAALSPSLTKCLSAGTRLDASREALRAALADALYQRLSNPALSLANVAPEPSH